MADGVSGVITKQNLIGTWGAYIDDGEYGYVSYTFNFNQDGTFSFSKKDSGSKDESYAYTGTWKLNNLGNIICQYSGEDVVEKLSSLLFTIRMMEVCGLAVVTVIMLSTALLRCFTNKNKYVYEKDYIFINVHFFNGSICG